MIPEPPHRKPPRSPEDFSVDPATSIHTVSEYEGPTQNAMFDLTSPQVDWFRFRCKNIPTTAEVVAIDEQLGADFTHRYNHIQRRVAGPSPAHPVYRVRWQQSAHDDGFKRYEIAENLVVTTYGWRAKTVAPPHKSYVDGDALMIIVDADDTLAWVENQLADEDRVSLWFRTVNSDGRTNAIIVLRREGDPPSMSECFRQEYLKRGLKATSTCGELSDLVKKHNSQLMESVKRILETAGTDVESAEDLDREFTLACSGIH